MICDEIKELTVPYLELDLNAERVHHITVHLEACPPCRMEMESVRQVLVRLKGRTVPDPGERFWNEFPAAVRQRLRQDQTGRKKTGRREGAAIGNPVEWWPRWSLALAASVMLLVGAWLLVGLPDFDFLRTNGSLSTGQAGHPAGELSDVAAADWERTWDDDDPDLTLVDLAAGLDPRTLDRLFKDI